jgi:hypothetical protein
VNAYYRTIVRETQVDIRRFRETLLVLMGNMTANAWAEHVGISAATISRWRSGQRLPGWESLALLNELYPELAATSWGFKCPAVGGGCLRRCEVTDVAIGMGASGEESESELGEEVILGDLAPSLVVGDRTGTDDATLDELVKVLLWGQAALREVIRGPGPVSTLTLATALGVLGRNAVAVARLLAVRRRLAPATSAGFEATIAAALDELKRDGWRV